MDFIGFSKCINGLIQKYNHVYTLVSYMAD